MNKKESIKKRHLNALSRKIIDDFAKITNYENELDKLIDIARNSTLDEMINIMVKYSLLNEMIDNFYIKVFNSRRMQINFKEFHKDLSAKNIEWGKRNNSRVDILFRIKDDRVKLENTIKECKEFIKGNINKNDFIKIIQDKILELKEKTISQPNDNSFKTEISFLELELEKYCNKETSSISDNQIIKISYRQFALYIYYLQEAKDMKPFGSSKGIVKEMKDKCNEFGYPSYKYFQSFYNSIRTKKEERINKGNCENIKVVADSLKDFPKAKKLAEDEMKLASLK